MLPGKQYTPANYAQMAWRRRWVIVVPVVVAVYVTLILASRLPNSYQSEMLIQVVPQRVPDAYVRSTITMRTEERLSSLTEQIMSRTELERLITQMNLYPAERTRMPMQDVVEIMRRRITVDQVRSRGRNPDTDAFFVRFSYHDPAEVARVTERLGALFIDVNARDRGNQAQSTSNFLQTQLADARRRLEEQELKLKLFRERNAGRLPTQLQFNMQAMQSRQLEVQAVVESLARDRDRKMMLERLYADAQSEPIIVPAPAPAAAPAADPAQPVPLGTTAQQLAAAREQLARYEVRLKNEHPDVIRTKRLVAELETRAAAEAEEAAAAGAAKATATGTPPPNAAAVALSAQQAARRDRLQQMRAEIESIERQIAFKQQQEERLRGTLGDFQSRIEQVPGVESEWIALTRDYDTQMAAYKDLLSKSEDAKLAADLEQRQIGEQFRIVDPARPPVRPTGVNRLEMNATGAAIGLLIGLALAALLELRDRTFRAADDVLDVFKLPVLAMVPHVVNETDRKRARWRFRLTSAAVAAAAAAGGYGFWTLELWKQLR